MFATSLLSRFMQDPNETHFRTAKRVLWYIKGTVSYGIWFKKSEEPKLIGFIDIDWARSHDDMKSSSAYVFTLGSGFFSWNSKKKDVVAQSTAEAEYIAAVAVNQAIWLRKVLADVGHNQVDATVIHCDSKSTVAMAKNPVFHGRSKHIKIKYHFLREAEGDGEVKLVYYNSEEQATDILTKTLPKPRCETLRAKLDVTSKITKEEC